MKVVFSLVVLAIAALGCNAGRTVLAHSKALRDAQTSDSSKGSEIDTSELASGNFAAVWGFCNFLYATKEGCDDKLYNAAMTGDVTAARYALHPDRGSARADPDFTGDQGPAFLVAMDRRHFGVALELIDNDVSPVADVEDYKLTYLLCLSIRERRFDTGLKLVNRGAALNGKYQDGKTPLHEVMQYIITQLDETAMLPKREQIWGLAINPKAETLLKAILASRGGQETVKYTDYFNQTPLDLARAITRQRFPDIGAKYEELLQPFA